MRWWEVTQTCPVIAGQTCSLLENFALLDGGFGAPILDLTSRLSFLYPPLQFSLLPMTFYLKYSLSLGDKTTSN